MMQTNTLRSLADDIDAMRHQIRQRDATIIRLRAERDTLERDNRYLERALKAALSELDPTGIFCDGFALGANLRTVGERVMDLSEDFGVPVC